MNIRARLLSLALALVTAFTPLTLAPIPVRAGGNNCLPSIERVAQTIGGSEELWSIVGHYTFLSFLSPTFTPLTAPTPNQGTLYVFTPIVDFIEGELWVLGSTSVPVPAGTTVWAARAAYVCVESDFAHFGSSFTTPYRLRR